MTIKKLGILEVAQILEDFLEGKGGPWTWDDFISAYSIDDAGLEMIRRRCAGLTWEFPPDHPREFCNAQGRAVIRAFVAELHSR